MSPYKFGCLCPTLIKRESGDYLHKNETMDPESLNTDKSFVRFILIIPLLIARAKKTKAACSTFMQKTSQRGNAEQSEMQTVCVTKRGERGRTNTLSTQLVVAVNDRCFNSAAASLSYTTDQQKQDMRRDAVVDH